MTATSNQHLSLLLTSISELQHLRGVNGEVNPAQLEKLQKRADQIRALIDTLNNGCSSPQQDKSNPSESTNNVYQNIPSNSMLLEETPPPLPPRLPKSPSDAFAITRTDNSKSLSELKEERKRLISLHLQEARRYFSELEVISKQINLQSSKRYSSQAELNYPCQTGGHSNESGEKGSSIMKKRRTTLINLPPRWGQDVAPPPTPFFLSPRTSPGSGSSSNGPLRSEENCDVHILRTSPASSHITGSSSSSSPPSVPIDSSQHTTSPVSPPLSQIIKQGQLNTSFLSKHSRWISHKRPTDRNAVKIQFSLDNELQHHRECNLHRSHNQRLSQSSNDLHQQPPILTHASSSTTSLAMSHLPHRSANLEQLYHEALPISKVALSHSGPPVLGVAEGSVHLPRSTQEKSPGITRDNRTALGAAMNHQQDETSSVISFTSSVHSVNDNMSARRREDIDSKIDGVNSLVSLLGCTDIEKMSRTFLAMSSSQAKCDLMRSHHVIPLLVQLLHGGTLGNKDRRPSKEIRFRLAKALSNIIHSHPSDKQCKREAKVLKLLETLRMYSDFLRDVLALDESARKFILSKGCSKITYQMLSDGNVRIMGFDEESQHSVFGFNQPIITCQNFVNYSDEYFDESSKLVLNVEETMAILTRCSFDEGHRQPIFLLGGIPVLAELIQVEKEAHYEIMEVGHCTEVRRFAVVALTNLTFGNANIKSFLCSLNGFISIMVTQLNSPHENLRKATAHLFRNLAWKADKGSRQVLGESCVVQVLMKAAMDVTDKLNTDIHSREEPTLKVILSALWNLSAHSRKNKADICAIDNVFPFLVHLLKQKFPSIVESAGGILRNISSFIATSPNGEEYRAILRQHNCLAILLSHLKSPSLTIVSNSCGTLWNFSARSSEDQRALWDMGAVPMLQSLTNSKHKTISTCSLAALKNLYSFKPCDQGEKQCINRNSNSGMPSLEARKKKNVLPNLKSSKLNETCDNEEDSEVSSSVSSSSSNSDNEEVVDDELKSNPIKEAPCRQRFHLRGQFTSYMKSYVGATNEGESKRTALVNNYLENENVMLSTSKLPFQETRLGEDEDDDDDGNAERPTDYSLRFQEDVDEETGSHHPKIDTVKTYCTEGTPYDTPYAPISTATSIGDLHQGHNSDEKPQVYCTEDTPGCYSRADSLSSLDSSSSHPNNVSGNLLQSINEGDEKGQLEEAVTEKQPQPLPKSKTVTFQPHETPLMFSRASSFESLNSFEQHSIRDGYSSCDFSRATSGRVSPTDLPDSPCQSRPRTPPKISAATVDVTGKQQHEQQQQQQQQQPSQQQKQQPFEPQRPLSSLRKPNAVFEDGVKMFKEEGTPINFSSRTSLSNLTFSDDEESKKKINEQDSTCAQKTTQEKSNHVSEEEDIYADSESILEAVITSGMPNSRDTKVTSSKSRLPRPKSSSTALETKPFDGGDQVKKFQTEDTPGFLSHAGSNSNLSALTIEEDDEESDGDLLEACIKSAMPKTTSRSNYFRAPLGQREDGEGAPSSTTITGNKLDQCKRGTSMRKSRSIPPTPPRRLESTSITTSDRGLHSGRDTPLHYATEDTPTVFSRNDSFSSLSCEEEKDLESHERKETRSLLPRPRVLGRSESSGSSQKSSRPNRESSASNESLQEANLLADCINSGMPKSRSEPLGFVNKKKKRDSSKSPRGSKLIPGVRIPELKLIPKNEEEASSSRLFQIRAPAPPSSLPKDEAEKVVVKDLDNVEEGTDSLASSICSNISAIQPPSIMDSLISMSERKSEVTTIPNSTAKLECRHTLSAKKGLNVPEMVRRAIIGINEDASLSSCQSNLDNIKTPTLLDEMDNSIVSIASISSEVANDNFDLIKPEAEQLQRHCEALTTEQEEEVTALDDILPPTLLDEVSTTTATLVQHNQGDTYTIDVSTCHDITGDVFDDETLDPTLTLGSCDADEAPELPRDSKHTTPAHSGGESSRESTPLSKRKEIEQYRKYQAAVPSLDESADDSTNITSGYKSIDEDNVTTPATKLGSRQRRKDDADRFKTHTITKEDLRKSDSDSSSSPKSIKQRRMEESDRFRTRTITAADLKGEVAKSEEETLPNRSIESPKSKPKIRKPLNSTDEQELAASTTISEVPPPPSIRGRRKPLYSNKPAIAPKPVIKATSGYKTPMRSGSNSVTPPRISPRTLSSSSASSVRSNNSRTSSVSSQSRVSSSSLKSKPPMVRQGTFTKEETGRSPMVAATRTSTLRERSASRSRAPTRDSCGSTSSLASSRSSKSSLKPSTSSQSLKAVSNLPKRVPPSSNVTQVNETLSESGVNTKKGSKKEVTSRIASLWKKVEDSKKKNRDVKDKRVWISKGKVIPESERALLRVDEEQKQIIESFKDESKPRSKSRLSIRLSKFSLNRKDKSTTPGTEDEEEIQDGEEERDKTGGQNRKSRRSDTILPTASAIVPPFNYNPPSSDERRTARSRSAVRRNDSYVSSMGRVPPEVEKKQNISKKETTSGSVMVTLV